MVYILLAPGFEEAEALVPADLLRRADIETALVSLDGAPVTGAHAITVQADLALSQVELPMADMVVLPGGGMGVKNLGEDPAVEKLVRAAMAQNSYVAAICAAPSLLGRWGLLRGKRAICYPGMEDLLTDAVVEDDCSVVEDGKLITGQGPGAAFDFGLQLVSTLAGRDKSMEVRQSVCYF